MRRTAWWTWWLAKKRCDYRSFWSRDSYRPSRARRARRVCSLRCHLEQTNARVDVDTDSNMLKNALFLCGRSIKNNWRKGMVREWKPTTSISKRAHFAVGEHQPYFLAEVFIEAANDLKTNRVKLPCESTYVFDVNKYPPKPLPKARRGAGRPHEKPFRECTGGGHDALWYLSSTRSQSTYMWVLWSLVWLERSQWHGIPKSLH